MARIPQAWFRPGPGLTRTEVKEMIDAATSDLATNAGLATALLKSDNLASVASKPTARTNLGLGTAAVLDTEDLPSGAPTYPLGGFKADMATSQSLPANNAAYQPTFAAGQDFPGTDPVAVTDTDAHYVKILADGLYAVTWTGILGNEAFDALITCLYSVETGDWVWTNTFQQSGKFRQFSFSRVMPLKTNERVFLYVANSDTSTTGITGSLDICRVL